MFLRRTSSHCHRALRVASSQTAAAHLRYLATAAATAPPTPAQPAAATAVQHPPRIVSGIQPTAGAAHLGNYLGAIAQWVKIQNGQPLDLEEPLSNGSSSGPASAAVADVAADVSSPPPLFIFLADLHALTARPDASQLRSSCLGVTATLLACGIDPARTTLFRQSAPQLAGLHTQLAWILGVATPVSWLQRMTQYKDKVRARVGGSSEATWGLLSYPALQAADILLYNATRVPVGKDQFQHVELCRDMAHLFNNHYASPAAVSAALSSGRPAPFQFALPLHVSTRSSRVMSLRSGTNKMSKSDPSDESRINLTDSDDQIATKVRKAKTDSDNGVLLARCPDTGRALQDDPAKPETANLVRLMAELSGRGVDEVLADQSLCASKQLFKAALTEVLVARVAPIREEFKRLQNDPAFLARVLDEGEKRAAVTAEHTMAQVRRSVGLD